MQISPEPTLTALAQLAALKLQTQRSFISIIDHNSQYILAEATRSVSLNEKEIHAEGDALYLGIQSLPLEWGVCPSTMKVFTDPGTSLTLSTPNLVASKSRYIVRDFLKENRLKDRPYVAGWPFMRFFAEVPIKSPAGYVVGGFCVIDDQPRTAFGDAEVRILSEIAGSITNHLEFMRMRQDYDRAERLMKGLSYFVEGQSSIRASSRSGLPDSPSPGMITMNGDAFSPKDTTPSSASASAPELALPQKALPIPEKHTSNPHVPTSIAQTLSRASNLIRESMDLCGVVFFDAYLSGLTGRSELRRGRPASMSSLLVSEDNLPDEDLLTLTSSIEGQTLENGGLHTTIGSSNRPNMKHCDRIGMSLKESSYEHQSAAIRHEMPEAFLNRMLRRYPQGQIFSSGQPGYTAPTTSNIRCTANTQDDLHKQPEERAKTSARDTESQQLFELFPGTHSIIFYPLWDSHKPRWFSGCLGWTTDPKRALQSEELTYLAAFSNSVMADINRVEAVANDKAKSDFISNISHELRSPLHGVLASAELLQESSTGPEQDGMISMVQSCGRTLLETMNHLLDYAKVTNIAKSRRAGASTTPEKNGHHEAMGNASTFDLGELVEEVVEAVHTGYKYQKRLSKTFKEGAAIEFGKPDTFGPHGTVLPPTVNGAVDDTVSIIVDIRDRDSWIVLSEAGAWRRIVMNLFGNALKYTPAGYIKVTVRAHELRTYGNQAPSTMVHLSITDTGKGISEEYLKHRLYTPFAQEDNLSVGAGLGLSIVQQIVTGLEGTVNIESKVGVGTDVTVSIPIEPESQLSSSTASRASTLSRFAGLTMRMTGYPEQVDDTDLVEHFSEIAENGKLVWAGALCRTLLRRLGLNIKHDNAIGISRADVAIVDEDYLDQIEGQPQPGGTGLKSFGGLPVIMLCRSTSSSSGHILPDTAGITYVHQPFGPIKLARAIEQCFQGSNRSGANSRRWSRAGGPPRDVQMRNGDETAASGHQTRRNHYQDLKSLDEKDHLDAPTTGPRVLLVDDNDINLKIMVTYMRKLNCFYMTAKDGLQAFHNFRDSTTPFDYVLMDVSMPVMDGLSATREIRAFEHDNRLKPTTVIALTGLASAKTEEEAFASGVNMFLTKPVQLKRLKDVLHLDGEHVGQENGDGPTGKKRKVESLD